jgi:hypothetical protein
MGILSRVGQVVGSVELRRNWVDTVGRSQSVDDRDYLGQAIGHKPHADEEHQRDEHPFHAFSGGVSEFSYKDRDQPAHHVLHQTVSLEAISGPREVVVPRDPWPVEFFHKSTMLSCGDPPELSSQCRSTSNCARNRLDRTLAPRTQCGHLGRFLS